ncbi:cytochrome b [Stutzerimonas kirkiae]|uniref:Cytochrome B n=1 Tax=Stutzerimonas kirkiae TaxID=2211392 RepID=A0A4Q9R193_9GAMM|nr:cytochrome b/b6 domain-containing protein [Stutzerimonas kirkiae]TBU91658.1 cytochrome B [Stutzerimonas kirkiae]TBV00615.1 cytochrome B [Stutzerimonas kirkiae]TBV10833.1 cytochrome B [Stutzerimonas kirkiae]
MTTSRFSPAEIALHWLSAILVLLIIALPYGNDLFFEQWFGGKGNVYTLHKSLGITVLFLTLLRLLVRRRDRDTELAVRLGHGLLYLLLLVMPITGLVFGSRPVNLFWLVEIGPLGFSEGVRDIAHGVHLYAQYALFVLILGHAAMALWHHYVRRDDTLRNMLPLVR